MRTPSAATRAAAEGQSGERATSFDAIRLTTSLKLDHGCLNCPCLRYSVSTLIRRSTSGIVIAPTFLKRMIPAVCAARPRSTSATAGSSWTVTRPFQLRFRSSPHETWPGLAGSPREIAERLGGEMRRHADDVAGHRLAAVRPAGSLVDPLHDRRGARADRARRRQAFVPGAGRASGTGASPTPYGHDDPGRASPRRTACRSRARPRSDACPSAADAPRTRPASPDSCSRRRRRSCPAARARRRPPRARSAPASGSGSRGRAAPASARPAATRSPS